MARAGYAGRNDLGWPAPDLATFSELVVLMQDAVGSQNDLALLLGVDYETVGAWRNQRSAPRGPALARMVKEFPLLATRLIDALSPGDTPGAAPIRERMARRRRPVVKGVPS